MSHNEIAVMCRRILLDLTGIHGLSDQAIPITPWDSIIYDYSKTNDSRNLSEEQIATRFAFLVGKDYAAELQEFVDDLLV